MSSYDFKTPRVAEKKTSLAAISAIQTAEYPLRKTSRLPERPEWEIENEQRILAIKTVLRTGMVGTSVGDRTVPYAQKKGVVKHDI